MPDPQTGAEPRRVVVFSDGYGGACLVEDVEALSAAFPHWHFLVAQQVGRGTLRRRLRNAGRRFRAEPIGYPLSLAGRQLGAFVERFAPRPSRPSHRLEQLECANVTCRPCARLHEEATRKRIREFEPWLGIALGGPILKPELFEIPELGTINLHKSLLPEYRGMPPGFWEIHDGASISGVTIHWIDAGLDTGRIIAQEAVPVPRYATPRGLGHLLDVAGTRTLLRTLSLLDRGPVTAVAQGTPTTPVRSRPREGVRRRVERDCRRRRRCPDGGPRRAAKLAASALYVHAWSRVRDLLPRFRGQAHTTVLLYHRVSDDFLDGVTIGVEEFEAQLRYLLRHYEVIDPGEFLAGRGRPSRRRRLVLTFDDGYRDNHMAARLLKRHGLKAAFFVSTRIVNSDRGFPHDRKSLGRVVPALSWEEIREMADWGLPIGNHTADHADLGAIPLDAAVAQVRTGMTDLEEQLPGRSAASWLAFPYGYRSAMPEALRDLLPSLGIEYCFSAYGGSNPVAFDVLDIRRQGVNHGMNGLRLRAAIEGWGPAHNEKQGSA